MGEVLNGVGSVLVKFRRRVIWHIFALLPKATAGLMTIAILHDGGMPALATDIVWGTVLNWDTEEDVVIDPFGDGADPLCSKNVQGGIAELAVNASG